VIQETRDLVPAFVERRDRDLLRLADDGGRKTRVCLVEGMRADDQAHPGLWLQDRERELRSNFPLTGSQIKIVPPRASLIVWRSALRGLCVGGTKTNRLPRRRETS
jgi:hypothetical protein